MIICNQLNKDGLGNHLFRIAATLAHARQMPCIAAFNEWKYADYFQEKLNHSVTMDEVSHALYKTITENQKVPFSPLPPEKNLILDGYWQSNKYFLGNVSYVLHHLTPKQELLKEVRNAAGSLLNLTNLTAVHVRRKEYRLLTHIFHQLNPKNYYEAAMDRIEDLTNTPRGKGNFLFFSDNIDYCKATYGMRYNYATDNSDIIDLFMMAMCRHHIIANSSYSWWGAYLKQLFQTPEELSTSITIAPATWFNPESGFLSEDIYCKDWIRI